MNQNTDTNLYDETIEMLNSYGKTIADVEWVGSADGKFSMSWPQFGLLAATCDYYSGYGAQEIAVDLVVVGKDWWLSRSEYDGAEGWAFHTMPTVSPQSSDFIVVSVHQTTDHVGWVNIAEVNEFRPRVALGG